MPIIQISKLCNASTHDKVAPTPQNLICRGKSAIEVIQMNTQVSRITDELSFTFVQNEEEKNGLIIMLDISSQMEPHWPIFRSALQQLFLTLHDQHFLGEWLNCAMLYKPENFHSNV